MYIAGKVTRLRGRRQVTKLFLSVLAFMIPTLIRFSVDATENSDERRVLLAITVEIDDGCVEYIHLREGDSAEAVAIKFCQAHALPEQFVAPLTEHIVSNIITLRCVV